MRVLSLLVLPFFLVFLLVRAALRLIFVPPTTWLLKATHHLGAARLPVLLLLSPLVVPGILLMPLEGLGRILEGDVLRPLFTLPYAFARGDWQVTGETDYSKVHLELGGSKLEVSVAAPLHSLCREDDMTRRLIDRALSEPALENGMRWAGMRMTTFFGGGSLTCTYFVWRDDAPEESCVFVKFTGDPAHEEAADDFVRSVMPEFPEDEGEEAATAAA